MRVGTKVTMQIGRAPQINAHSAKTVH
jgi:hypothetical protein